MSNTIAVNNIKIPSILYGTAWKEDETQKLVELALETGFLGIDTANQRKHYYEQAAGNGLANSYTKLGINRSSIFLQTKYTYVRGQDHRLPYDGNADIATQVKQSFASSLEHLKTDYIDSYVLHGPSVAVDLGDDDWDAWRAMEDLYKSKLVRFLGISNVNLRQLELLYSFAKIKPTFVQNRCFAQAIWDKPVRDFCAINQMIYQGFSLLTANQKFLQQPQIKSIASKYSLTIPQVIFSFSKQIGMQALTGTTDKNHMQLDLAALGFQLSADELDIIEHIAL